MRSCVLLLIILLSGCSIPTSTATDYDAHLAAIKKRVPDDFTLIEETPFVVLSDQSDRELDSSILTVRWTVQHLKRDFFTKDPDETIDIWLFKSKTSYKRYTWQLFQDEPTTPYGYYSPRHHALFMNISTGSGTLVHEIVHPFMQTNFPACPAWFNEGLASLFEQSTDRKGHIVGLINWRLPKLQQAIRDGKILSFQQLTALSSAEFYGGDDNPNYSQFYGQARYLCYYLQEHGLLVKFYHEFTANVATDPTGYATLQHVLRADDMSAFQKKWEEFVLTLKPKS